MKLSIPQSPKCVTIPSGYNFTFTDNPVKQIVNVSINAGAGKSSFPFVLWSGAAYSAAGDYTQGAITVAVAEYLSALTVSGSN